MKVQVKYDPVSKIVLGWRAGERFDTMIATPDQEIVEIEMAKIPVWAMPFKAILTDQEKFAINTAHITPDTDIEALIKRVQALENK